MNRVRAAVLGIVIAIGGVLVAAPAAKAVTVSCGQTVSGSVVLTADVGPCPNNGVIVGSDGTVLDLNGHRIFGTTSPDDGAGVLVQGRTGVRVLNGTIERFDAGVALIGGGSHVVQNVSAINNIGDGSGSFGDGIAVESSANNRIIGNLLENNGPYSGVGLYTLIDADHPRSISGPATGNVISGNQVLNNVVPRGLADPTITDNDGIRVEGSSSRNQIVNNVVFNSGLDGISLFANTFGNILRGNDVRHNGYFRTTARRGSGIIVFNGSHDNIIEGNKVTDNADNGISLRPAATTNIVRNNDAAFNVTKAAIPSGFGPTFDLNDANVNCDSNLWRFNRYHTANPVCTTVGGTLV